MKDSGKDENLEIKILMEVDNNHSSDGEDDLAFHTHKQAAGTLEEYKEDSQQLPGDEGYGTEEDEDKHTSEDVDIIQNAELFMHVQDEAASNPKSEPKVDNCYGNWDFRYCERNVRAKSPKK